MEPDGLLLTAAVAAGKQTIDSGLDIPAMAKYIDILNVMAYNFHGTWHPYTHHNTPLHMYPEDETEWAKTLNVVSTLITFFIF